MELQVATLLLTHDTSDTFQHALSSPSLRTWLDGDWAILFSHPNDFVSYDLEMDRWVVITRRAFADRQVRPIALGQDHGWVSEVSGEAGAVLLEDPKREHFGPVDLQAPLLREEIERAGRRFVMIIDNSLRVQKKLAYESLAGLPSPLELLGWADALRAKQAAKHTVVTESAGARRLPPSPAAHPGWLGRYSTHGSVRV
jgi:alkyl hydroperoxide reductase subunit AhpC